MTPGPHSFTLSSCLLLVNEVFGETTWGQRRR